MQRNNCPIKQHSVSDMVTPTTFQHFVELEKNAKYYAMLLRIREKEVVRCTKAYEDLQVTLKCCLSTNSKLKDRIELLEQMITQADESKRRDTELYQNQMADLTRNIVETKRNGDVCVHELENEFKRKILEAERLYADKLNKQEIEFDKRLDEMNIKLQRETAVSHKLKRNLESIMNMNVGLKSTLHILKSKHSSDKSSLEVELNELKDINKNVSGDVVRLRRELDRVTSHNEKFKQIIVNYQTQILKNTTRLDEISRINKNFKRMNSKLKSELWAYKQRNEKMNYRLEELIKEEGRSKEEIERLKVLGNALQSDVQCNIPEHSNYEHLTQQNAVLQEIVKTMRKERNNKDNQELRRAESRIIKLEDAIEDFKKSGLIQTVSVHEGGQDGDK